MRDFSIDLENSKFINSPDGIGLSRRHEEKDCDLIIWAANSFHASGKIMFRESSWMVAIHLASSVFHGSVVRANYRLSAEIANACAAINGESIDHVRNQALEEIGAKMKKNYHMLQLKMLIETGGADLASFIM